MLKWIHLSDLHFSPPDGNFDTGECLAKLMEALQRQTADAVFFTGDFRNYPSEDPSARQIAAEVREIAAAAGVTDDSGIHLVPGDCDLTPDEPFEGKTSLLNIAITRHTFGRFKGYVGLIPTTNYLLARFSFFGALADELRNTLWADMLGPVHRIKEYGDHAILYMNTAVASGRANERGRLLISYSELERTLGAYTGGKPIIALGHHSLDCMSSGDRRNTLRIFRAFGVRMYLCGDSLSGGGWTDGDPCQFTAGWLKTASGTAPAFHAGTLSDDGSVHVETYMYDQAKREWSLDRFYAFKMPEGPEEPQKTLYRNISGGPMFGHNIVIGKLARLLASPDNSRPVEVSGPAGSGKSSVCAAALEKLGNGVRIDARLCVTLSGLKAQILLAIGADISEADPESYDIILAAEAAKKRRFINIEDADLAACSADPDFLEWLSGFPKKTGWGVVYSTERELGMEKRIIRVAALDADNAVRLFLSRWGSIDEAEEDLAREMISGVLGNLPLNIILATAPGQRKVYKNVTSLKAALEKRSEARGEVGKGSPRPGAALALAASRLRGRASAKNLWAMLASYPGDMDEETFYRVFDAADMAVYSEGLRLLRENGLLDGFTMPRAARDMARGFDDDTLKIGRNMRMLTFDAIFADGADPDHPNSRELFRAAGQMLAPALASLKQDLAVWGSGPETLTALMSALEFWRVSESESDALDILQAIESFFEKEKENPIYAYVILYMALIEHHHNLPEEARLHFMEAQSLLEDAGDNSGLASALKYHADMLSESGKFDEARVLYSRSVMLFSLTEEDVSLADALSAAGELESRCKNHGAALELFLQAAEILENADEPCAFADALADAGDQESGLGMFEEAREHYAQAILIYRREEDEESLAGTLYCGANVEASLGNLDSALKMYTEAMELLRGQEDREGLADTLLAIGDIESGLGDYASALVSYRESEEIYFGMGEALGQAEALRSAGNLEGMLGMTEESREHLGAAAGLFRSLNEKGALARTLRLTGDMERRNGSPEEADACYREAAQLYLSLEDNEGYADVLKSQGDLEKRNGNLSGASDLYRQAMEIFARGNRRRRMAGMLRSLAEIEMLAGRHDRARDLYLSASDISRETRDDIGLAMSLKALGDLETRLGNTDAAGAYYEEAQSLLDEDE